MEKQILIDLIEQKLSTYKMAEKLNCSQTNVRHWLRKYNLRTNISNNVECTVCKKQLQGNQMKFCSNICKQKANYNNTNTYHRQTRVALERKQYLIDLRGGGCEKCGYNKCTAALDFHHNSGIKNFTLDSRKLSNTTMKRILEEFNYCKILCANCHREEHYYNK